MLGADLLPADDEAASGLAQITEGSWVAHSRFGDGEVISDQGHGLKRSVTIHFPSDGSRRTFRLSHVDLTPIERPS
jgi:hypothetical protein